MLLFAIGVLAIGCCPEPEGCLESPGTLRYRVDASEEANLSCGQIDLSQGDVLVFDEIGEHHPSKAERQCSDCPLFEVTPTGEVAGWSEIERRDTPPDRGRIVSAFRAIVDGCSAEVELVMGPIDREGVESNFRMFREIVWDDRCDDHSGLCYDEFLMTELPAEE